MLKFENIETTHVLRPEIEIKVHLIAACLLPKKETEVRVKVPAGGIDQEVKEYLNVIKGLCIDFDMYNVSGNGNVINFINGSKIVFSE